jgi:curved DNA-binding protein CbpA
LLALVDGWSTVTDLAAATSTTSTDVTRRLQALELLGAISWVGEAPAQRMDGVVPSGLRDRKREVSGIRARGEGFNGAVTGVTVLDAAAHDEAVHTDATRNRRDAVACEPDTVAKADPVAEMEALFERAMRTEPSPPPSSRPDETIAQREAFADSPETAVIEASTSKAARADEDKSVELALDAAERERIDAAFSSLEDKSYYELLGLDASCDRKAIREAYFRLSKQFHPDTKFRKELGPYKSKMEAVFARLTEAYDVLGKPKRRAEYDEYLSAMGVDARPARGSLPAPPPDESNATAVEAPTTTEESCRAEAPAAPRSNLSPERAAAAAARLRRSLGQHPPVAAQTAPTPALEEQQRMSRDARSIIDDITRSIAQVRGAVGPGSASALARARAASANGDLTRAQKIVGEALRRDPDHPELRRERDELHRRRCEQLADREREDAEKLEQAKQWMSAALCWKRVAEGRPGDAEARFRAARALLQTPRPDLRVAHRLLQEAILAAPQHALAHLLLTHVYVSLGMKRNAQRELELATRYEAPENDLETLRQAIECMA